MVESLKEMIKRHEGLRLKPYKCTAGKLTIGYGRNLADQGINKREADILLTNDINRARSSAMLYLCDLNFPKYDLFDGLSEARQNVLIDMGFNLGYPRLKQFKKLKAAIIDEDFNKAAEEMLDSKWARQVGSRAIELSEMMIEG